MVKFLGGSCEPKSDDKPRVKEADTVKIPAFPLAETYRNWKIKTREAVVAASADLDNTFRWVSESWKETQTREALWKVAPLATLDAKLLSALANSIALLGTSHERLIPIRKRKLLPGESFEGDKSYSCSMIISV